LCICCTFRRLLLLRTFQPSIILPIWIEILLVGQLRIEDNTLWKSNGLRSLWKKDNPTCSLDFSLITLKYLETLIDWLYGRYFSNFNKYYRPTPTFLAWGSLLLFTWFFPNHIKVISNLIDWLYRRYFGNFDNYQRPSPTLLTHKSLLSKSIIAKWQ